MTRLKWTVALLFCCAIVRGQVVRIPGPGGATASGCPVVTTPTLLANTAAMSSDGGASVTTAGINTSCATLIVVQVSSYDPAPSWTLTDAIGGVVTANSWTGLTKKFSGSAGDVQLFYAAAPAVGANHTFKISGATTFPAISVMAFKGVTTTTPFDQQNQSSDIAPHTTLASGSITAASGDLVVTGIVLEGTTSGWSIDSSFIIPTSPSSMNAGSAGNAFGGGLAYFVQPATGALAPTWSWTTSSASASSIASFHHQ